MPWASRRRWRPRPRDHPRKARPARRPSRHRSGGTRAVDRGRAALRRTRTQSVRLARRAQPGLRHVPRPDRARRPPRRRQPGRGHDRDRRGASVRDGARRHRRRASSRRTTRSSASLPSTRRAARSSTTRSIASGSGAVSAADEIGDGIFLVFSRSNRPIEERLSAIASRLEAAPQHIEEQKSRLGQRRAGPPVERAGDRIGCGAAVAVRRGRRGSPEPASRRASRDQHGSNAPRAALHRRSRPTAPGSRSGSRTRRMTSRWAATATTSWCGCARSTTSIPTRSSPSARSS